MFLFRKPPHQKLEAFAERASGLSLSYGPVGITRNHVLPGFQVDRTRVVIGRGEVAFLRAKEALSEWRHFKLGWVEVFPRSPSLEPETTVLVVAHHLGFWSVNSCRVVYSLGDRIDAWQFGFAYGTLMDHAERGEEVFRVTCSRETGEVAYEIKAVSRPRAALAWLGYPFTRHLQARFRHDSTAAMAASVA